MGEVFAAENIRTGRPVAVKLLRADSKSKSSAVERFRREARAAGSINSDHVTQVLDVEDDSEHGIVIVFELLEGESLIDRLKRTGPIPFDELHPIIEEVWVGLSDAHKVGIIHRDLKPSNVFLERRPDGQQRVKILDFGISKLPKEMGGETLTEMGQSLGTFSFMPPEQIGRAKTVDHRADIYATTTMIYQSLTGQLPYVARNILVMVELKSKTDPRPLSEALGHQVDQSLETFVKTGLARNPADRFQNALDALERWRALKHLDVPESRRAMSGADFNAQARGLSPGSSSPTGRPGPPLPAAGRPPSGLYPAASPPQVQQGAPPQTATRIPMSAYGAPSSATPPSGMAPAPVAPAAMLEPVMSGALPRLYDQTESTTDVSHVEVIPQAQQVKAEASGVKSTLPSAGTVQRGQELRPGDSERKGPQGTRVLPQSIVQEAVQYAAQRKASQGDLRNQAASAQAQNPSGTLPSQPPQSPHPMSPQGQQSPSQIGPPQLSRQSDPRLTPQPGWDLAAQQRNAAQAATPMSGVSAAKPPSVAPPPPQSSISGPMPASGVQQHLRNPGGPDPRGQPQSSAPPPISSGVQQSGQGMQLPQGMQQGQPMQQGQLMQQGQGLQQGDPRASQLRLPPGLVPAGQAPGPVQLSTIRLPDEPSSIPASQDKTQVYRPKQRKPEKKQSVALFIIGAIAFAVVGFSIVYVVQYFVRSFH